MNKTYVILLVILCVVTFLAAFPALVLICAIFTLGLAWLVAAFAPNALLAMLCFMPAAARVVPKPVGLAIGAVLVAALAYVPGMLSQSRADAEFAELSATDALVPNALAGRAIGGIDFIRPQRLTLDPMTELHPSDLCGLLCQRVLHGGQVDWIRVILKNHRGKITQTSVVTRGQEADCAPTLCFVYAKDTGQIAGLTLEVEQKSSGRSEYLHQWRITLGSGGDQSLVFQQTEMSSRVVTQPTYLFPNIDRAWNGHDDFGFELARRDALYNPLNPEKIAEDLGLKLGTATSKAAKPLTAQNQAPGPSATARIASLLETTEELTDRSEREIRLWMMRLENADKLTPAQIDVVFNVLEDQRFEFPPLHTLFAHPEVVKDRLLPWAFDTLETRPLFKPGQMNNVIGMFSNYRMGPALLAPYLDRYLALLDESNEALSKHNRNDRKIELWKAVGRFGINPVPLLQERFGGSRFSATQIMSAVCLSETKWHAALTPVVRETIARRYEKRPGTHMNAVMERGLNFLFFSGHEDEVRAFVAATSWSDRAYLLKRTYSKDKPRRGSQNSICW